MTKRKKKAGVERRIRRCAVFSIEAKLPQAFSFSPSSSSSRWCGERSGEERPRGTRDREGEGAPKQRAAACGLRSVSVPSSLSSPIDPPVLLRFTGNRSSLSFGHFAGPLGDFAFAIGCEIFRSVAFERPGTRMALLQVGCLSS